MRREEGYPVDETEVWLAANDPAYKSTSKAWKHVKDAPEGKCHGPREEIPSGSSQQVLGRGNMTPLEAPQRACRICNRTFVPREAKNDLCGAECRSKALKVWRRAYQRDLMRQRRAA